MILLDCGAAPHATAEDLVRFAAVGASYARIVGIESPRIGLLSIGGERGEGDHLRKQTDIRLAEEFAAEYVGAVEGHDLMAQARAAMLHEGSVVEIVHASVACLPELNARGELA